MVAREGRAPAYGDTGAEEANIFQGCMDGLWGDPMRGEGEAAVGNKGEFCGKPSLWRLSGDADSPLASFPSMTPERLCVFGTSRSRQYVPHWGLRRRLTSDLSL